jgi:hypothetical protein
VSSERPPADERFVGVTVPAPDYADDDGSPDPALAQALEAYGAGTGSDRSVVAALAGTRLMAPLVAVLDTVEPDAAGDGLAREKDSHMATVSLVGRDGRRALLAFTSVASMAAWDPDARGVPAPVARVAVAALQEGADAVLLDLGGPVRFALAGAALLAVAAGEPWHPAFDDADVHAAVGAALAGVEGLASFEVQPSHSHPVGSGPDLVIVIEVVPTASLDHVADVVAARLATEPLLVERCPSGVGVAIPA